MTWSPDDIAQGRHPAQLGGPVDLSDAENRWMTLHPDLEPADRRRARDWTGRLSKACHGYATQAILAAAGLINATAATPPASNRPTGLPSSPGRSDPVADHVETTIGRADRAMARYGHLINRCPACDDDQDPYTGCGPDLTLADIVHVADDHGLPATLAALTVTSPAAHATIEAASHVHQAVADDILRSWHNLYRAGAEPPRLTHIIRQVERARSAMASIARDVDTWTPAATIVDARPRCTRPGCHRLAKYRDHDTATERVEVCRPCYQLEARRDAS